MLDESILTGESVPVDKNDGEEAFSGTLLVRGKTNLNVTRTGAASAMGRLAGMLGGIQTAQTPLERRVDRPGDADRAVGAGARRCSWAWWASLPKGSVARPR